MSPAAPRPAGSQAVERIVALALAAMAVVLFLVWLDLVRAPAASAPPPFDWTNPLLSAKPGECVEVTDASMPGVRNRLVVRAPGVVLRPHEGPARIEGWVHPAHPDPRRFPPYLLCERRVPAGAEAPGQPAAVGEPLVFPLNSFGMVLESICVPNDIQPQAIDWAGQRRKGHVATLLRYGELDGPWLIYLAKDVPVLGTVMRRYTIRGLPAQQTFLVPDSCR